MGYQFDLEDVLENFWEENSRVAPLQRWTFAIIEVVLPVIERAPAYAPSEGKLAIFIDEVDIVRSLPFSADEFFAAIRECYNRRAEDPDLRRLNFALFGVASPFELMRDTRMTPFNIGTRIELQDFTPQETVPLRSGLSNPVLLPRILEWTGGHPYLTLRLCAAARQMQTFADVDRLVVELFFTTRSRETDDNLLFVRERLLRSEVDLTGLLHLYRRIHQAEPVADEETNPLISILRLAGIVRVENGLLKIRNSIYARVFDLHWTETVIAAMQERASSLERKGKEELLLHLISRRFEVGYSRLAPRLKVLSSDQLDALGMALFDFTTSAALESWMADQF